MSTKKRIYLSTIYREAIEYLLFYNEAVGFAVSPYDSQGCCSAIACALSKRLEKTSSDQVCREIIWVLRNSLGIDYADRGVYWWDWPYKHHREINGRLSEEYSARVIALTLAAEVNKGSYITVEV